MSSAVPIYVNPAMIALLLSAFALVVAWLTFNRAGDWRQSDAGKDTSAKLALHAERLTKLETSTSANREELALLRNHAERITVLESQITDVAKKADIAAIGAEIDGIQEELRATRSGVTRIEDFLLARSK